MIFSKVADWLSQNNRYAKLLCFGGAAGCWGLGILAGSLIGGAMTAKNGEKVEEVRRQLTETLKIVADIRGDVDAGREMFDREYRRTRELLDVHGARLAGLTGRVEVLERKQHEIAGRVEVLERKQHETAGRVEVLERKQDEAAGRVEVLERKRDETAGRVEVLERKRDETAGRVEVLERKLHDTTGRRVAIASQRTMRLEHRIFRRGCGYLRAWRGGRCVDVTNDPR